MILKPQVPAVLLDEAHIKSRIVCNQHAVPDEFKELRKDHPDLRIFHDHLIGNTRKIGDLKGDRPPGVDEGAEPVRDLPAAHFYRADLDDPVPDGTETGGLNIEDNISIIQRLTARIHGDLRQVVHHVAFHPVDDFEGVVFVQCFNIMIGVRECLGHAVIRNGNGRMAPVVGALHNVLHLGHSVHIAHFRMAVKFHPLHRAQVIPGNRKVADLLDPGNGADGQFAVEFINGRHALDLDKCALLQFAKDLRKLLVAGEHLHSDRVIIVRHRKHDDRFLVSDLTGLKTDDLSVNGDLAHLGDNLVKGDRLVIKVFSVDQVRIIALFHRTIEILFAEFTFPSGSASRLSGVSFYIILICSALFLLLSGACG